MTTTTDAETLRVLAQHLASLQAAAAELAEQIEQAKAAIVAAAPGPGTYDAGGVTVRVSVSRRLDTRAVSAAWPIATHPHLFSAAVDTAAVRRHVAEVDLEPYMVASKPSVTLA